jgi:NitT/TauT family transport system substrate-binding protein
MIKFKLLLLTALIFIPILGGAADRIRIAIGTQDTTINCGAGGAVVRELHLLEKYLPHDGNYKNARYDIIWQGRLYPNRDSQDRSG